MATELAFVGRPFEGFERALDRQFEAFAAATDEEVTLRRDHRPLSEIHEELIAGGGLDDGEYDLLLCHSDWLPEAAEAGLLTSLDGFIEQRPPADWPEGWAEPLRRLLSWRERTYAIPYHDGPEIFHYRRDLFESAAEQRRFRAEYGRPLTVPRTWGEFREVASFFTRPDDDLWGTVVAARPDGHNDVYDFLIQLWSRGGEVLDDDGGVAFDSPTGVAALQFYHDLIHEDRVVPPAALEMESVESGEFYAAGKAAMMWNWSGFGAMAESPDSPVFGNAGYGLIPRGEDGEHTSLVSLYGLAVPASSGHPELAYDFLRHAASPEMDRVTTLEGASGCRLSTWRDPEVLRSHSSYPMVEEINTGTVRTLPRIPGYMALNGILNRMVERAVVERTLTPAGAIEEAAAEAERLLDG